MPIVRKIANLTQKRRAKVTLLTENWRLQEVDCEIQIGCRYSYCRVYILAVSNLSRGFSCSVAKLCQPSKRGALVTCGKLTYPQVFHCCQTSIYIVLIIHLFFHRKIARSTKLDESLSRFLIEFLIITSSQNAWRRANNVWAGVESSWAFIQKCSFSIFF